MQFKFQIKEERPSILIILKHGFITFFWGPMAIGSRKLHENLVSDGQFKIN